VIESLTDAIERQARTYLERIDQLGGALKAIEAGYIQGEIGDAAYATQRAVERGEQIVVGVNQFQVQEELHLLRQKIDPAIEFEQKRRLADCATATTRRSANCAQAENAARAWDNLCHTFWPASKMT
jgi:methylmalonyl-CoA mutase N-terminal domain/subunit